MNIQIPLPKRPAETGWRRFLPRGNVGPMQARRPLMVGAVLLVAVVSAYLWLTGGRYVSTDNAYVQAPKLVVAPDISGIVSEVLVREGQAVKQGDVLFRIDAKPFGIALDNAKAQLAQTALTLESMKLDYKRALSDIAAQEAQVQLAKSTFDRAALLVQKNATTVVAYDQARSAYTTAQNQQKSLQEQAKVMLAKLANNPEIDVTTHPQYLQGKAIVDEAQRQLDHTAVRAPFNGIVTQVSQLQPGTYLVAATAALSNTGAVGLVGSDQLWIDANFKETDLTWVKPGDTASITVDTYPGRTWTGKVASIAPASGAAFSILPAQNASGNWVKVVQRIPVRVLLDPSDGPQLRAGMSVDVTIDTRRRRTLSDLW